ncbi:Glyoxalase-like domain-containing protein [Rhizobiales bacterium GAS191]|nr:Glyoxalase-like domain-containing protein [Rhizobiales bacterium GAS191]
MKREIANGDIDSVNHVGVAVRDMDEASLVYEALGFTLSPLSVHSGSAKPGQPVEPMATGNRCAIFPHNYIEVLGIVNPGRLDWSWGDFIKRFQGGHIICFGCQDAAIVDRRVAGHGIKTSGVIALQRDIDTLEGTRTARFDCVHFDRGVTPEGLIQAARHRNPEYVHQERYLGHRNGARALADVVLSVTDPEAVARRFEKLTGQEAQGGLAQGRGFVIDLPKVSRLIFLHPEDIAAMLPGTLFSPPPSIAAMGFSVEDPARTEELLHGGGFAVSRSEGRVIVPAEQALGVVHYFVQEESRV